MTLSKNYYINHRSISCNHKDETPLCKSLLRINHLASYNDSRMSKLEDEYKCSPSYHGRYMHEEGRSTPNCSSYIYSQFTEKFQTAVRDVSKVYNKAYYKSYSTYELRDLTRKAKESISELKDLTYQNKEMINLAFETALYDTNLSGTVGLFSMLLGPIGFATNAINLAYNNDFDGKIDRAFGDIVDLEKEITTLGVLV